MMNTQSRSLLEHYYFGRLVERAAAVGGFCVTAHSPGLDLNTAERIHMSASLGSYNQIQSLARLQHGYGLLRHDHRTYVLSHVRPGPVKARGNLYPDYHCVVVPQELLEELAGNLASLLALLDSEAQPPAIEPGAPPLERKVLKARRLSVDEEAARLNVLFESSDWRGETVGQLITSLAAGQSVAVTEAPTEPQQRWDLCQALLLALPSPIRHQITFATEVFDSAQCTAMLKFLYKDPYVRSAEGDVTFNWNSKSFHPQPSATHPYTDFLAYGWRGGAGKLASTLRQWEDGFAEILKVSGSVSDALAILGDRLLIRQQVLDGSVKPESLARLIEADPTLSEDEFREYSLLLLVLAVRNNRIELTEPIIRKRWISGLTGELRDRMVRLAKEGLGRRVFRLLQNWLGQAKNSYIDSDYWTELLHHVALYHLSNLTKQGAEDQVLEFISEIEADDRLSVRENLWRNAIELLRPIATASPRIAKRLVSLTCRHQPGQLAGLLTDRQMRSLWPSDVGKVVLYLSEPRAIAAPPPGLLIGACRAFEEDEGLVLQVLARAAIQRKRSQLLDAVFWKELQSRPRLAEYLSGLQGDREWVNALGDRRALFALASLRVSLSQYAEAASLLYEMQSRPSWGDAAIAEEMGAYFQQDPSLTGQGAVHLALSMQPARFSPSVLFRVYVGTLERVYWRAGQVAVRLAQLVGAGQGLELTEDQRLGLLGSLARSEGGDMARKTLSEALVQATDKPQWEYKVRSLSRIAEQLEDSPGMREEMTRWVGSYASQLPDEQLSRLHRELIKQQPELLPEARTTYALLNLRHVLGGENLKDFADRLNIAYDFLARLQHAFGPSTSDRQSPQANWDAFDRALQSQLGKLDQQERARVGRQCKELAYLISDLGDGRTRSTKIPWKSQRAVDDDLEQGRAEPGNAVDALKRLAGLFQQGIAQVRRNR